MSRKTFLVPKPNVLDLFFSNQSMEALKGDMEKIGPVPSEIIELPFPEAVAIYALSTLPQDASTIIVANSNSEIWDVRAKKLLLSLSLPPPMLEMLQKANPAGINTVRILRPSSEFFVVDATQGILGLTTQLEAVYIDTKTWSAYWPERDALSLYKPYSALAMHPSADIAVYSHSAKPMQVIVAPLKKLGSQKEKKTKKEKKVKKHKEKKEKKHKDKGHHNEDDKEDKATPAPSAPSTSSPWSISLPSKFAAVSLEGGKQGALLDDLPIRYRFNGTGARLYTLLLPEDTPQGTIAPLGVRFILFDANNPQLNLSDNLPKAVKQHDGFEGSQGSGFDVNAKDGTQRNYLEKVPSFHYSYLQSELLIASVNAKGNLIVGGANPITSEGDIQWKLWRMQAPNVGNLKIDPKMAVVCKFLPAKENGFLVALGNTVLQWTGM